MSIKTRLRLETIRYKNELFSTSWLVFYSIFMGSFFMKHNDFLINRTEPYLQHIPTGWIGVLLVIAAVVEVWAVIKDHTKLRYIGVVTLATCWGALTLLSFTYHIGSGYPDNSWISHLFAAIMAFVVAYKGVYRD